MSSPENVPVTSPEPPAQPENVPATPHELSSQDVEFLNNIDSLDDFINWFVSLPDVIVHAGQTADISFMKSLLKVDPNHSARRVLIESIPINLISQRAKELFLSSAIPSQK